VIYEKLIKHESNSKQQPKKWLLECNFLNNNNSFDWKPAYLMAQSCTNSAKLVEFQFPFLHRRLPSNAFSHRIGMKKIGASLSVMDLQRLWAGYLNKV